MATTSQKLPPLPAADVPIQIENRINPDWYQWLKALEAIVKKLREEV